MIPGKWRLALAVGAMLAAGQAGWGRVIYHEAVATATQPHKVADDQFGSGTVPLAKIAELGPNRAEALTEATAASWSVTASTSAAGVDEEYNGGTATGFAVVRMTDLVQPWFAGYHETDSIEYEVTISIEGLTRGQHQGPGGFMATMTAGLWRRLASAPPTAREEVWSAAETLDDVNGYLQVSPQGRQTFKFSEMEPYELQLEFSALAHAYAQDDDAQASAQSDWGSTLVWEGVTAAQNLTTGESIPLEDFHLYGEDGFDWAHPPEVPEPAGVGAVVVGWWALGRRRRGGIADFGFRIRRGAGGTLPAARCLLPHLRTVSWPGGRSGP